MAPKQLIYRKETPLMRHVLTMYRDAILASTGIIIAMISLVFAIWQGREEIRHNHISVKPGMNACFANESCKNQWGIYVINNSRGTAFVNGATVTVNDKHVAPLITISSWGPFRHWAFTLNVL